MKKTLFITTSLAAALSANAEMVDYVQSTTNGTWVWGTVTITEQNQHNYLTVPDTEGNYVFSGATAATLNVGVSQGEGSLIITDNGKLVTPNGLFVAGRGINNPDTTYRRNNGSVTVTKGGELTIAGCTWDGPYHNPTASGAQLSLANSYNVKATLDITAGGRVHANAETCVAGGNCEATVNIDGAGSVLDFALRGETVSDKLNVYIGMDETSKGTVNVKNGGLFTAATSTVPVSIYLGHQDTATGTLNIDNATANLGTQAGSKTVLGKGAGNSGTINVTNGGSLTAGTMTIGDAGTGALHVDASSTATFSGEVTMNSKSSINGSGTVNLLNGATLTNNGGSLDIGTLSLTGNATANLSSDAAGTINIANIITKFNSADKHGTASASAVLASGGSAAANLKTNTMWFFEIDSTTAEAISTGTSTKYLTDLTGIKSNAYFCAGNWYEAVTDTNSSGTCIAKKEVSTITDATLTTTESSGLVTQGKTIADASNNATIGGDKADLYVRVETAAQTTGGVNGTLQVTSGDTTYAVNNAYVSSTLTLDKTDLVAAGSVTVQGNVNLTQSNITSTTQGTVLNSTIKGTGTLTKLDIVNSTLIAGNSPGTLTLAQNKLTGSNTLGFYVGSQAADALQGHDDAVSLTLDDVVVTSGFIIESGTVLSGDITLELWSNETSLAYETGRIFDTLGDSLQLFKLADGVDASYLSTALGGATFILGDTFGAATTWGWDTSKLASEGKVYVVVPEPATATLSLLALAGLCARRRRK